MPMTPSVLSHVSSEADATSWFLFLDLRAHFVQGVQLNGHELEADESHFDRARLQNDGGSRNERLSEVVSRQISRPQMGQERRRSQAERARLICAGLQKKSA
jgi:hypothetical protein